MLFIMKTFLWKAAGIVFLAVFARVIPASGQVQYTYPLAENFHGMPATAPDLIPIPNNSSATGQFVERTVPASTCGIAGNAEGYFFEDDAGLQFNNPAGFIGQSYSIAFNFQVDEFITPPNWVRLLSFTHIDDVGIYIRLTDPPNHGTLEFWPYGTVGTYDFFTTVDFYQMILVRSSEGLITVYVNGQEFAQYDDSESQAYVPQPPNNYIIWFRDDPSVLANEASPGFVSDIIIGNVAWTPAEVQVEWNRFCSSLLGMPGNEPATIKVYPNPAADRLRVDLPGNRDGYILIVYNGSGLKMLIADGTTGDLDVSAFSPGLYLLEIVTEGRTEHIRFVKR
jgi:hypothetical protein